MQRTMQQYGMKVQILRPYAQLQDKSSRSDGRFLFEFDGNPCIQLLLDRDYWVMVTTNAAKKGSGTAYAFNPKDGRSALNIAFGDGYEKSDAMIAKSPGFTKITHGKGMVANTKVVWRRWADGHLLYSDCTIILPAQGKKIKTTVSVMANSEARRQILEECLSSLRLLDSLKPKESSQ